MRYLDIFEPSDIFDRIAHTVDAEAKRDTDDAGKKEISHLLTFTYPDCPIGKDMSCGFSRHSLHMPLPGLCNKGEGQSTHTPHKGLPHSRHE